MPPSTPMPPRRCTAAAGGERRAHPHKHGSQSVAVWRVTGVTLHTLCCCATSLPSRLHSYHLYSPCNSVVTGAAASDRNSGVVGAGRAPAGRSSPLCRTRCSPFSSFHSHEFHIHRSRRIRLRQRHGGRWARCSRAPATCGGSWRPTWPPSRSTFPRCPAATRLAAAAGRGGRPGISYNARRVMGAAAGWVREPAAVGGDGVVSGCTGAAAAG